MNKMIRNVAIVAHVDHGKTTLVDQLLRQGGAFRANQSISERVMDSNSLERERGITILAKNTSVTFGDYKINIVDTPGHADFSGEVERILKMVNGVLLLVDASEGTMPQTRFVLSKALELNHKIIIVINKVDRPDSRIDEVIDEVLNLLLELDANEKQLDSPIIFCSGRRGLATTDSRLKDLDSSDLSPLFEAILSHIDPPSGDEDGALQLLVSALDYNDYVGAIAIGRIERGQIYEGMPVIVCNAKSDKQVKTKIANIYQFEGLNRISVPSAGVGDIVCVSGAETATIGDTISGGILCEPLDFVSITEPSVEMTFAVNDSPFAGREGKFVTSRTLRDRLYKEAIKDVSLRVSDGQSADAFLVAGRGEMHLSILIENMRRDGYEFSVSMPRVLYKTDSEGNRLEPVDKLVVEVPENSVGAVMEKMGIRKGELVSMIARGDRMRMEFKIPSRGLFGFKSEFLTDTKGEGIMSSVFIGYEDYKGDITRRLAGSLIAHETGEAVAYGLFNAQERGLLFIGAGTPVYEGMIVGQCPKAEDIVVNVCKRKQLTNMRASGSDDALRLNSVKNMSLEQCLEFIADDELLEVTPKSLRIRKKILDKTKRLRARV